MNLSKELDRRDPSGGLRSTSSTAGKGDWAAGGGSGLKPNTMVLSLTSLPMLPERPRDLSLSLSLSPSRSAA